MKKILSLIMVVILMFSFTACSQPSENVNSEDINSKEIEETVTPITIEFKVYDSEDDEIRMSAEAIKSEVEEKTQGRVIISIVFEDEILDSSDLYGLVAQNKVNMAFAKMPYQYDIGAFPYLAINYDDVNTLFEKDSNLMMEISEIQESDGVKLLGVYTEGFTGVGSVNEIAFPETLETLNDYEMGINIEKFIEEAVEGLGFNYTYISEEDMFSDVQQGMVYGIAGETIQFNYEHLNEVITYYYQYNLTLEVSQIYMNLEIFNSLTKEDQAVLKEAVLKQTSASIINAQAKEMEYEQLLSHVGVEVKIFTDEELEVIAHKVRSNTWGRLRQVDLKEILDAEVDY